MANNNLGIYVHIPFCNSKCAYCNFNSGVYTESVKKEYVLALVNEIKSASVSFKDRVVDTIFIGGGTPSVLPQGLIASVLSALYKYFKVDKTAEITVECNPNSLTAAKLREYKNAGVNRLSIGLQAYSNKLLKMLNRPHTRQDFVKAVKTAKMVGFTNINADLLLAVPNSSILGLKMALNLLCKLNLTHISCYGLILEDGTPITKQISSGAIKPKSEDFGNKSYTIALKKLNKKGYRRYEVSNFAKQGFESKHNSKYWSGEDYLGVGAFAHSKIGDERFENIAGVQEYIDYYGVGEKQLSKNEYSLPRQKKINSHTLTKEEKKDEFVMLGLRKTEGISLEKYNSLFDEKLEETHKAALQKLMNLGLIDVKNGYLKATNKGFEVLNQIILELS